MKKKFKILGIAILAVILIGLVWYYSLSDFEKYLLSPAPRKPKHEIPITYNIGWWSDQKALTIDSLQIDVVESNLNIFNGTSLISYKVSGQLKYEGDWEPKIELVHISERINQDTALNCDRIIEITPVIVSEINKKKKGGKVKFDFKNEHSIISNHYGKNRIKFICVQKEQIIELLQKK